MIQYNIAAIKNHAKSKGSQRIAHHSISERKLIEEFFLFFELNTSSNLDLNYSKYPGFTLENNSEDVFLQNFSLEKTI